MLRMAIFAGLTMCVLESGSLAASAGVAGPHAADSYTRAFRHLYTSYYWNGTVERFPLDARGFPSTTPDAVYAGMKGSRGMAVDSHGALYVADDITDAIFVFAPNWNNDPRPPPVAIINIPRSFGNPETIGVTDTGYIFSVNSGQTFSNLLRCNGIGG